MERPESAGCIAFLARAHNPARCHPRRRVAGRSPSLVQCGRCCQSRPLRSASLPLCRASIGKDARRATRTSATSARSLSLSLAIDFGGGVKGAEVKGGEVKDAPFWAPWARPAARRRVRTPHAAFANAADEDEEPPPAAAAARK